jgi:hypothetical protein
MIIHARGFVNAGKREKITTNHADRNTDEDTDREEREEFLPQKRTK